MITRRKFFSFFGTGVVLAAAPKLLLRECPSSIKVAFSKTVPVRFEWTALDERVFFALLMNPDSALLPNVPYAADGAALYTTRR